MSTQECFAIQNLNGDPRTLGARRTRDRFLARRPGNSQLSIAGEDTATSTIEHPPAGTPARIRSDEATSSARLYWRKADTPGVKLARVVTTSSGAENGGPNVPHGARLSRRGLDTYANKRFPFKVVLVYRYYVADKKTLFGLEIA